MSLIRDAFAGYNSHNAYQVALEEVKAQEQKEEEIVIYAKIGNMEGLTQASHIEQHEQAEIKTETGRIRIRKTTINGRLPVYELTSKIPVPSGAIVANSEKTKNINEQIYDMFMEVCPTFMSKTRYVFKAERLRVKRKGLEATIETKDLAFEVDVFTKGDGSISPWCKIDIETDQIAQILRDNGIQVQDLKIIASISGLPFEPDNIAIDSRDEEDPERQEFIKALYEYEFLIKKKK
jgi:hypothetical protein